MSLKEKRKKIQNYTIYKKIFLFGLDFYVVQKYPNLTFNKEKTLGQPGKNISLTLLKMLIK